VTLRQGSGTRLKALEAMAAGRPLVGSDVGLEGLGLQNGVSAYIANNGQDLAQAAVRLLSDDGMARSIAEAARLIAVSRFGWDRVSEEYLTSVWALTDEPANPSASRIGK
jgi:glycosyltransferase involved in cell wall biosynthesis